MLTGVNCVRGIVSMADHEKCMLHEDHPCGYTEDMLVAMTATNKERAGVKFSPSSLQGCSRQAVLQRSGDYYLNVDHSWPMLRGTMAHAFFETLPAWDGVLDTLREYRFETTIPTKFGDQIITGKADLVVIKNLDEDGLHIKVVDFKSKGEIKHDLIAADPKHVNQINIYGWLAQRELYSVMKNPLSGIFLEPNDLWGDVEESKPPIIIDALEICYFDMKKVRRFTSVPLLTKGKMTKRTYPKEYETLELEPIPIKKADSVERWIRIRVERQLAMEQSGQLPAPLSGEDTWVCSRCPVQANCIKVGEAEGYDMEENANAKSW